jgi:hypothetical protein
MKLFWARNTPWAQSAKAKPSANLNINFKITPSIAFRHMNQKLEPFRFPREQLQLCPN